MNATPAPFLPTRRELEELLARERPRLVNLAKKIANTRDDSVGEDLVQSASLEVLQKIDAGLPFVDTDLWRYVCWTLRNRAIDRQRRRELRLLQDLAAVQDDESPDLPAQVPAPDASPDRAALDRERFEHKKKLLSDILEEYCRRCESQPRMLSGKEIFERMLRGESPEQTAAALGMKRNTIDKARRDAREKLRDLMEQHDVHHTVFQTFFRREMEHPFQGQRKNAGTVEVQTTSELFRWIMDEAGALCPPPHRLRDYLAAPEDELFRDIRYHVKEARCPLCCDLIDAWA